MTSSSDDSTTRKGFPDSLLETLWQLSRREGSSRSGGKSEPTRLPRGIVPPTMGDGNTPLTPEELRAVESIMGKKRPGLITFGTPLHRNEKMEDMFERVAKGRGASYTPGYKLPQVPAMEKIEGEPVFDDLDALFGDKTDWDAKKNEPPKTNAFRPDGSVVEVSAGDVSKRYKNPRPAVLHFNDPDAEHIVRIGLMPDFDKTKVFRFYLCRWNPDKRWLTAMMTYVFEFWFEETEADMPPGMPSTYHLTER
jgi:hypothetical protein